VRRSAFEANSRQSGQFLIGRIVGDRGIGLIGDGAGKNVGRAAAFVRDVDLRDFDLFVGAIEIEVEMRKLANAEFAVDADEGVDFFAGIAVGFEADFRFEELDLGGSFRGCECWVGLRGPGLRRSRQRWILGARRQHDSAESQANRGCKRQVSNRN